MIWNDKRKEDGSWDSKIEGIELFHKLQKFPWSQP